MDSEDIQNHYSENKEIVEERLEEFKQLQEADDERLFLELVFVILTSQTQAKNAWEAVFSLKENDLLLEGESDAMAELLESHEVQYEHNKAGYVTKNRKMFSQPTLNDPTGELKLKDRIDPERLDRTRSWFVENVNGLGWKGASHFLRNIGYGNGFAIISSRISSKMYELGLLDSPEPPSDKDSYLEAERDLKNFSEDIGIDIKALDLVLWSMETGEVFR